MIGQEKEPAVKSLLSNFTILLPGATVGPDLSKHFLIDKNHKEHHIFFNNDGFHNHLLHHYLSALSLGATNQRLQEIYDFHASYMRPLPDAIHTIDLNSEKNDYQELFGNHDAYTSFLNFFTKEIKHHGMMDTIRKWVFRQDNDMLSRTIGGIYHPLIHLGYAVEFNLPNVAAEGLALAACEDDSLLPFLKATTTTSSEVTGQSDESQKEDEQEYTSKSGTETFESIIAKVKNDSDLDGLVEFGDARSSFKIFTNDKAIAILGEYAAQWEYKDPQTSLRELYIQSMLLYASTGIRGQEIKLDFFLMHCLTSMHAMQVILPHLSSVQVERSLRFHVVQALLLYVRCGRPSLEIKSLQNYKAPGMNKDNDNPWLDVVRQALNARDVHCIKAIRALALGQIIYRDAFNNNEDLWLKAAQATLSVAGVHEDTTECENFTEETRRCWNFDGIGFEETWNE
ncbi:hypothetical protein INT45_009817 [Circinella minor]|uniref:Oxidoreductase AflY n=1 Tax=Circinella minor TaxID=1195481 RepID=A0A8H7S2F6_9FUNG|nr:hypothetical protein INT45_009817 [Circinella minor]